MTETATSLASFTFPRTGKRGVPQQFPRRLYEMLDSETKLSESSPSHPKVICWSSSGKAFRIYDTTEFANVVLPKYFRTKKFSSFQRNLNLYGFTKIRRGPDVDMYAHPSFMRDTPETLLHLRKITTGSRSSNGNSNKRPAEEVVTNKVSSRTVSPLSTPIHTETETNSPIPKIPRIIVPKVAHWGDSLKYTSVVKGPTSTPVLARSTADRGKLDLLALALEQAN